MDKRIVFLVICLSVALTFSLIQTWIFWSRNIYLSNIRFVPKEVYENQIVPELIFTEKMLWLYIASSVVLIVVFAAVGIMTLHRYKISVV